MWDGVDKGWCDGDTCLSFSSFFTLPTIVSGRSPLPLSLGVKVHALFTEVTGHTSHMYWPGSATTSSTHIYIILDSEFCGSKGLFIVPRWCNARGFTDPLSPCGPSLRPPQGPDVRLPKIVTLRRGHKGCDGPQTTSFPATRFVCKKS